MPFVGGLRNLETSTVVLIFALVYAPIWHDVAKAHARNGLLWALFGIIGMVIAVYLAERCVSETLFPSPHLSIYRYEIEVVTMLADIFGSGVWFMFYTRLLMRIGKR
jgi:hypothetical protein